jgi:class 3 adenylate cyclase
MSDEQSRSVRFGDYVLDRADERLIAPHGPVRIGNKAFRVLDAMTRTRGRLLTKDELFDTVWDGTTVSESALTSVIKELRHALRDDRRAPTYIASVYGRGYRFLPEVQDVARANREDIAAASSARPDAPQSTPQRTAERRLITAMSVDLVDVARQSADVDPEDLAYVLARHRERVTECVTAEGGHIVSSAGDGVLACFGWPDAREDAAECAIRAGFSIVADLQQPGTREGSSSRPRIGIATGIVIIGIEADGARHDVSLIGEAPIVAAQLRHVAVPGTIAIAEATQSQIGGLFECESLGERSMGGAAAPIQVWRPLRAARHLSRFQAVRTVKNSFVGRMHELSLLADRWRMAAEGDGRTVIVLGEAGMGKSRLVDALLNQIVDHPHTLITWQCSPYHQVKPLYPAVEYLAHAAGIDDADTPIDQLRKLTELLVTAQMPLDGNLSLLAHLLSISPEAGFALPGLPPDRIRSASIAALIEWLRCVAVAKPLLFMVEDVHWIDATTLELLSALIGSLGDSAILAVITARPEFASPWSGRAEVSTIGLDRLSDRDCASLAQEIVGATDTPSRAVADVVSRSDGNPLYVEELSAALREIKTVTATRVPDSLQSSLMARLDQLGGAKKLAQTCAVLGRRFARPLLSHVADLTPAQMDMNLALLIEHDVVRPIGSAGGGRYEFKHALLRDAAYESMLFSVRRRLHEACGRRLEELFPDVARTEPELLAQHFRLSGLSKEAVFYSEVAGDRATAACAFQEAIASYEEAIRHNDAQPPGVDRDRQALRLLLKLGPAIAMFRGAQAPELRDIYRRAETLSRSTNDNHALFKAVWGLWYNANISRDLDDAGAFAQELVVIAEQTGDDDLGLEASHCRWSSALFSADYRSCLSDARHGARLYDRHRHHKLGLVFGGHDPGVCAFGCLGQAQVYAGDVESGFASVGSAIALAEQLDHPGSLAHGFLMGLIVGTVARETALLQSYAERTLDLSQRFKLPPQQAIGTYHLAWIEAETGNRDIGLRQMSALYDRVTAIGPIILLYKVMYVDQLLRAGRVKEALATADQAVAELRCPDRGLLLSELLRLRGECLIAQKRRDEGSAELIRAEAMAKRNGGELLRLRAAVSLYNAVGEPSRSILEAAVAATPNSRHKQELVQAGVLRSR